MSSEEDTLCAVDLNAPDFAFRCRHCNAWVAGVEAGHYLAEREQWSHVQVTLVKCPQCERPAVMSHSFDRDSSTGVNARGVVTLPAPTDGLDPAVPGSVAKSYLEATRTFGESSAYTATALMCRRALEAICSNLGAEGKGLWAKLQDLRAKGTLDARIFSWADEVLRNLGNDAAHEVGDEVSREDAEHALKFTRAIIEYLYVFEAAYQDFQVRRVAKEVLRS